MVYADKLSGMTSLTTFPPILTPLQGWLSSSNEGLFKFAHEHNPNPSTRLSIPAWSAVRWWGAGPFHRGARPHWSQHWPAPCCFALRDAKYSEVAVFQISQLSVVAGSHRHSPQEEDPQRKPRATLKHMLHKRTAGFSEQPCQPWRNPGSVFFQMETSIPSQKKINSLEGYYPE